MRILITGGGGYIGSMLVDYILKHKPSAEIVVLDSFIYDTHSLDAFKDNPRLKIIQGDITSIIDLVKALKGCDAVIAFAAIVGDPACALNKDQTTVTNYHTTELLVELCNYYKIKRLIFASSCSVYGASDLLSNEGSKLYPLSLYAQTRVMSEKIIMKKAGPDLTWTILRFSTVYGWSHRMRFDLVVNFLTAKAFFEKNITVIGGEQWRPLAHVADVARAVSMATFADKQTVGGEVFNIGGNDHNYQIKSLVQPIKKFLPNVKIQIKEIAPQDRRNYRVSFDKIRTLLHFQPQYTLTRGIQEIISNLKKTNLDFNDDKYYNVKYMYKTFNKNL